MAVSGGVDSSTTLFLLREQGYEIIAAHMKIWDYADVGGDLFEDGRCCTVESINNLQQLCNAAGIPFYVLNFVDKFREIVIDNFVSEYRAGRTPNPCVLCNIHLKWDAFLKRAEEIGCDFIATGHYSKVEYDDNRKRYILKKGIDPERDQSYFLWGLEQKALSKTLLPLGQYKKSQIREIAGRLKLKTAGMPESRETCFVADNDYHRFLTEWDGEQGRDYEPGDIVDDNGQVIGRHKGIPFYTIGQRKGMGIAHPTPLYVREIDAANNQIIASGNDRLYSDRMHVKNINWLSIEKPAGRLKAGVKIRYLHRQAEATIIPLGESEAEIIFDEKQRAITPGQSAVFYDNDIVLGGGIIDSQKNS